MTEEYDDAWREVMGRPIEGTPLHILDLYMLGEGVLNAVGTTVTLGHMNPANSLDYTLQPGPEDHVSIHILRDLLAWTSGRKFLSPGCHERLTGWVAQNWQRRQLSLVAERLGLDQL